MRACLSILLLCFSTFYTQWRGLFCNMEQKHINKVTNSPQLSHTIKRTSILPGAVRNTVLQCLKPRHEIRQEHLIKHLFSPPICVTNSCLSFSFFSFSPPSFHSFPLSFLLPPLLPVFFVWTLNIRMEKVLIILMQLVFSLKMHQIFDCKKACEIDFECKGGHQFPWIQISYRKIRFLTYAENKLKPQIW